MSHVDVSAKEVWIAAGEDVVELKLLQVAFEPTDEKPDVVEPEPESCSGSDILEKGVLVRDLSTSILLYLLEISDREVWSRLSCSPTLQDAEVQRHNKMARMLEHA